MAVSADTVESDINLIDEFGDDSRDMKPVHWGKLSFQSAITIRRPPMQTEVSRLNMRSPDSMFALKVVLRRLAVL